MFNWVENKFKSIVYTRADKRDYVFYFSGKDFEGLNVKPFSFNSSLGHKMQGYFYYYDNFKPNRLIVFDHGMWSGHQGYMKEVEMLARHGYLVYSYDHTGCMESGGDFTNGFAQSLHDLDNCLGALENLSELSDYEISVMGHSWGGYSTMNISALHPKIKHVVALSGFISVRAIINQSFSGFKRLFRGRIYECEKNSNKDYVDFSAEKVLANTEAKALIIHSKDDKTVSYKHHFQKLLDALDGKENIRLLTVDKKGHNPNYTEEACKYKNQYFNERQRLLKKGLLNTTEQQSEFVAKFDWHKMTEQDPSIWNEIFDVLDN